MDPQNKYLGGGGRELSQNGNKFYRILLSNELVYGIIENNACSKLEENRPKIATCIIRSTGHNFWQNFIKFGQS